MRRLLFLTLFCVTLLIAAPAGHPDRPTALDVAQILIQSGGSLDEETINRIFSTAFGANMRIPPEHMGVIFYDSQSGAELDHQKVRELIGPVRQDGTRELLEIAAMLAGDRLPMELDQLTLLMDAAFIASMRRPPENIDIEFYDRRHGPTGKPGGGVSGRVPDEMTRSPIEPQKPPADPYTSVPDTVEELARHVRSLGLNPPPRANKVTFVVPLIGTDAAAREQEMRAFNAELQAMGAFIADRGDRAVDRPGENQSIAYQVVYLQSGDEEVMKVLREELAPFQ